MKNRKVAFRILSDIQIISALIWAAVILLCAWIAPSTKIFMVLITAAGFHVLLLAQKSKKSQKDC